MLCIMRGAQCIIHPATPATPAKESCQASKKRVDVFMLGWSGVPHVSSNILILKMPQAPKYGIWMILNFNPYLTSYGQNAYFWTF
jgi:hypothetical protein